MDISEITVADLFSSVEGEGQKAALAFALAQNHFARVEALQKFIDFACNLLEKHKHKKKELGEDEITLQICEMLMSAGFQASHDEDIGGHCDIVVKGKGLFLWLAEAKKHSDYGWLDKGFQQLATRYSTGVCGQDYGEVLVYCYVQDAKAVLAQWRRELEARNGGVKTEPSPCGNPLLFNSTHKHASSGLDFHIRHKAIALYWNPQDG